MVHSKYRAPAVGLAVLVAICSAAVPAEGNAYSMRWADVPANFQRRLLDVVIDNCDQQDNKPAPNCIVGAGGNSCTAKEVTIVGSATFTPSSGQNLPPCSGSCGSTGTSGPCYQCIAGQTITGSLKVTFQNNAGQGRFAIGAFFNLANPTPSCSRPAYCGTSCNLSILPVAGPSKAANLDNDCCGDLVQGQTLVTFQGVSLLCPQPTTGNCEPAKLSWCTSWDTTATTYRPPKPNACTPLNSLSPTTGPGTPSKCACSDTPIPINLQTIVQGWQVCVRCAKSATSNLGAGFTIAVAQGATSVGTFTTDSTGCVNIPNLVAPNTYTATLTGTPSGYSAYASPDNAVQVEISSTAPLTGYVYAHQPGTLNPTISCPGSCVDAVATVYSPGTSGPCSGTSLGTCTITASGSCASPITGLAGGSNVDLRVDCGSNPGCQSVSIGECGAAATPTVSVSIPGRVIINTGCASNGFTCASGETVTYSYAPKGSGCTTASFTPLTCASSTSGTCSSPTTLAPGDYCWKVEGSCLGKTDAGEFTIPTCGGDQTVTADVKGKGAVTVSIKTKACDGTCIPATGAQVSINCGNSNVFNGAAGADGSYATANSITGGSTCSVNVGANPFASVTLPVCGGNASPTCNGC